MRVILSALVATVVATANAGFVAPIASGYIYRSDNNGPASLIQLGAVSHQQPHAFTRPLPLVHPLQLQPLETYDLIQPAPVPLPYIASKPVVILDTEHENDSEEDSKEYLESEEEVPHHGHGHAYEKGAGSEYGEEHHEAHGEKASKGYNSKDNHADGASGSYGKKHHEDSYKENEGVQKSHHDEANAHGKHHQAEKSYKGDKHGNKKHFSKGEDITGYHKVFYKDEFKKDHDFYDVADKSGYFNKYDHGHVKHGSKDGTLKEGAHHNAGFNKKSSGKAGFHAEGRVDKSDEGHSTEEGNESHYNNEEDYAKKDGKEHEKEYAYDDDDDDEDED